MRQSDLPHMLTKCARLSYCVGEALPRDEDVGGAGGALEQELNGVWEGMGAGHERMTSTPGIWMTLAAPARAKAAH